VSALPPLERIPTLFQMQVSVKQRIVERLKQFHRGSGEQAIIHVDSVTAEDFRALTYDEAGSAVHEIEQHGPEVISKIGDNPILWDASDFEVVAFTESERRAYEEQERRLTAQGKPRLRIGYHQ
jgi:hypothetical protein